MCCYIAGIIVTNKEVSTLRRAPGKLNMSHIYNIANPTTPTAPKNHDAAFACAAPPVELAVGEAAVPLPLALPLAAPVLLVPLGLPDMFSWVTDTPLPFLQLELKSDWERGVLTRLTSEHCHIVSFVK